MDRLERWRGSFRLSAHVLLVYSPFRYFPCGFPAEIHVAVDCAGLMTHGVLTNRPLAAEVN